ncbi:hypothetical protein H2O64_05455 [Kordia sp. YSTF-M3]|uniref:DUF3575 domain-containing protein n=1 Tax=Kordia aestuariivivens TaxID=2759037 RepID=A0ABR7Q6B1_9FLAO|nr:hypothetical protein [Kordia aestuariivivens]MBC8754107.1 hypothetical protein [Kordia aestuariivivens]
MKKKYLIIIVIAMFTTMAFSQEVALTDSENTQTEKQKIDRPHTIGSSLWVLSNLFDDPDHFYKLSYGYQFTEKDNIIAELLTWTYDEPLGEYGSADQFYPGQVKAFGIGFGYQRFHWKKLFTTVSATNFLQKFENTEGKKIQNGYQLYLQLIVGYRVEFFKKRLYVEPAYSFRYWPVNTNFPDSFAEIERGKRNYKIEASLNFGFRF